MKLALEDPRSVKLGVPKIAAQLGQQLSARTLKRLLKAAGYVWKRLRRSVRSRRNEADYQAAKEHLAQLRQACAAPDCDFELVYFDGAGFTLVPCVPYGWQPKGETLELPSRHSRRLNVLGFLSLRGGLQPYVFEGRVDTQVLIECFDDYCQRLTKPCLVVLDNASVQTSALFQAQRARWEAAGLYLLLLPPYCPELNLIEILWRKLKYEWLPLSAYQSFQDLQDALDKVLKGVGTKYQLSFG